jgi:glycosyltransferase involved in cell wall biosynthesis
MVLSSRPIVLTTRTFDGYSGVSRVASDVLLALSRCSSDLRVRAWVPSDMPATVDGLTVGPHRLEALPQGLVARAVLSGDAPARSLLEHVRLAAQSPAWRGAADPEPAVLEIVNGIGAHPLYRRAQAAHAHKHRAASFVSALIVHESPRHFDQPGPKALANALEALRSYDHRVFVSDRGRMEWNALAALDPARSLYIPNCVAEQRVDGIRARDRAQLRSALGYEDGTLRLVCLGSVTPRKGQDLVLDALRALGSTHPLRVDFLGLKSSAWSKQLASTLRGSPLESRVRFLGVVQDAYERIYAADALVLASRAEAFPLAVLEALALGTCVVAADVDGVAEQVVHAQSGLLFAREDTAALAACLRQIATDPPLRAALGAAGRARYLAEFTRARQLRRWADAVAQMSAADNSQSGR